MLLPNSSDEKKDETLSSENKNEVNIATEKYMDKECNLEPVDLLNNNNKKRKVVMFQEQKTVKVFEVDRCRRISPKKVRVPNKLLNICSYTNEQKQKEGEEKNNYPNNNNINNNGSNNVFNKTPLDNLKDGTYMIENEPSQNHNKSHKRDKPNKHRKLNKRDEINKKKGIEKKEGIDKKENMFIDENKNKNNFFDYEKYRNNNNNVTFSTKYKDSCITLSPDKLTCYGDKGWSSVFVNSGADIGKWYFEVKFEGPINKLQFVGYKENSIEIKPHIRVGFACRYMRYDTPIGTDKYSFCVNSKNGNMFNKAKGYACMEPFKINDVIGCYLYLKNKNTYNFDPRLDNKLYEFIQGGILCDPQNPPQLKKNQGSYIFFSLNGLIKRNAFYSVYEGFYHPAVSLYMGASARINLGPHFKYRHINGFIPCIYMQLPVVL
ncbi:SPRY domain, putative [Hepatocystis sp. ex Piliocolobus tephrosceles]|nr:SPRY domain, putative [Hepatocystis sp. ex Piliocolobus tephrosceles]